MVKRIIFLFSIITSTASAQTSDLNLLKTHEPISYQSEKSFVKLMVPVERYYSTDFFTFSSDVFHSIYFPKSIFLVIDRTLRSGKLNMFYAPLTRRNEEGLIEDSAKWYKKR